MNYSKRGQIGLIETIMVLVVIIILIVIGIYFYYKENISSVEEVKEGFTETDAKILLTRIPNMPEIKCSSNMVERECVDMGKLFGFSQLIKNNLVWYKEDFGKVNIIIEQVYPEYEGDCTKGNYPECKTFKLFSNTGGKQVNSIIVSLYDPKTKTHRVGKLKIER